MVNVNSCPGSVESLPDINAVMGVPKLRWATGPEDMGRDG